MGAWGYMHEHLHDLAHERGLELRYNGRIERSSPAEGSLDLHHDEQARIVAEVFADVPTVKTNGRARSAAKSGDGVSNGAHRAAEKSAAKATSTKSRS